MTNTDTDENTFAKWKAKLKKEFRWELKEKLALIKEDIHKVMGNLKNYQRGTMKKEAIDLLANYSHRLIHEKDPAAKKLLEDRREQLQNDPDNYHRVLKPGPAQVMANLTRKKEALEEALR